MLDIRQNKFKHDFIVFAGYILCLAGLSSKVMAQNASLQLDYKDSKVTKNITQ